jgi:membrane protease YdiL (CAAX protease family)
VWHTVVFIAGIALLSFTGAKQLAGEHARVNRMQTYAFTLATELVMLVWVYFGMRLRRIPFRTIFGDLSGGVRTLVIDLGSAAAFWVVSLTTLGTLRLTWMAADASIHHRPMFPNGKPDASQQRLLDTLARVAPSHGAEFAVWIAVCVMAGLVEEVVFRGYFQRQFAAWGRGAIWVGVVFSSLLFGFGHGYQGAQQMVLLSVFGAMFSLLAIFRRNIRSGIIAHAWQDIFAGMMIALARALHQI